MTYFAPDPAEQAARICDMHARAEVNRRLDTLEGLALAGELEPDQIQQLRRLQARARLAGLRRRYL